MSKYPQITEKIARHVLRCYQKIEDGMVSGYKKTESAIVTSAQKVTDKCIEVLFAKEGESINDAKIRLSGSKKTD